MIQVFIRLPSKLLNDNISLSDEGYKWLIEHFGECSFTDSFHFSDDPVERWRFDYIGHRNIVFSFKNKKDAMFFKLTWG